jgi:hypothetical protein
MRPSTKDNQGSGGKDGKEAWEFDDGPSSEGESFVLFLATVFCDGKICRLDFEISIWMDENAGSIYTSLLFSANLQL